MVPGLCYFSIGRATCMVGEQGQDFDTRDLGLNPESCTWLGLGHKGTLIRGILWSFVFMSGSPPSSMDRKLYCKTCAMYT